MKMNSTTRAKSSLVALVVLSLIFVGLTAVAYPALSLEGDDPSRETESEREINDLDAEENDVVLIRGIGGYVLTADGDPMPGVEITLAPYQERPLPSDTDDRTTSEDGTRRMGTRGDDDRDYDPDNDRERKVERKTDRCPILDARPERNLRRLRTTTDRTGFFQFQGIERGAYLLEVLIDGKIVQSRVIKYSGEGSTAFRIIIRSEPDSYIVRGKVVDERKQPVPGARVQLTRILKQKERPANKDHKDRPSDTDRNDQPAETDRKERPGTDGRPNVLTLPSRTTTTDRSGNFGFRNVPEGSYILTVEAKGFKPHKELLRVHKDSRVFVQLKHLQRDRPSFRIQAKPMDRDGDGIFDDVMIHASIPREKPLGGVKIFIDGIYVGETSREGWLFSSDYERGEHKVKGLYKDQHATTSFSVRGSDPEPERTPERPMIGTLRGSVLSKDGDGLTPLPNVEVVISNRDNHFTGITERGGKFEFELLKGEYVIVIKVRGYNPYEGKVVIEGREITEMEIFLEK